MTLTGQAIPAAQYLRMSTDHQQYSFDNQIAAILAYAAKEGFVITHTYSDAGKSGLVSNGATACGNCSTTLWVV